MTADKLKKSGGVYHKFMIDTPDFYDNDVFL